MNCNDDLQRTILRNLERFDRRASADPDVRHAAVALIVTDVGPGADLSGIEDVSGWSNAAALVLTRRAQHLRAHPGQWALPGGRLDEAETAIVAALRETWEEVGVRLPHERVLGLLDDFVTRSGFAMTPVVVWGGAGLEVEPNPAEVASVHRIPLTEFLRDDAPRFDTAATSEHPILRMPIGDDYIAAPTAALLYQFREVCIEGRTTRVDHFEQPEFAWR